MKVKLLSHSAIEKKYSSSTRGSVLLPTDQTLWLPSEALGINWMMGGGIPYGKLLELFGYESTGKSLLAYSFAKCCQSLGGIVLWVDAEFAFQPGWAVQNGLDLDKVEVYEGNDIEGMSDWSRDMATYYRSILTNNEPILLVIDSLATLECDVNINGDDKEGKAQMGNRAKAIYQFYRKRTHLFKQLGISIIAINQVRKKLGASMFESNETTPGGDSTKFAASIRISLNAGKQIKGIINRNGFKEKSDGKKFGRTVYVGIAKNKVAPPKSNIKTQVHFTDDVLGYTGYSKYHGLPDILVEDGTVTNRNSRYYYGEHLIAHGEEAFLKFLSENAEKRALLIKKSTINTVSKTRALTESIKQNLFPVKAKSSSDDEDE